MGKHYVADGWASLSGKWCILKCAFARTVLPPGFLTHGKKTKERSDKHLSSEVWFHLSSVSGHTHTQAPVLTSDGVPGGTGGAGRRVGAPVPRQLRGRVGSSRRYRQRRRDGALPRLAAELVCAVAGRCRAEETRHSSARAGGQRGQSRAPTGKVNRVGSVIAEKLGFIRGKLSSWKSNPPKASVPLDIPTCSVGAFGT